MKAREVSLGGEAGERHLHLLRERLQETKRSHELVTSDESTRQDLRRLNV